MLSEADFLSMEALNLRRYSHTSGMWKEQIPIWCNKFD